MPPFDSPGRFPGLARAVTCAGDSRQDPSLASYRRTVATARARCPPSPERRGDLCPGGRCGKFPRLAFGERRGKGGKGGGGVDSTAGVVPGVEGSGEGEWEAAIVWYVFSCLSFNAVQQRNLFTLEYTWGKVHTEA